AATSTFGCATVVAEKISRASAAKRFMRAILPRTSHGITYEPRNHVRATEPRTSHRGTEGKRSRDAQRTSFEKRFSVPLGLCSNSVPLWLVRDRLVLAP